MTIALTEDLLALRDSVRGWIAHHVPGELIAKIADAPGDELPPFWPALSAQGLPGVHVPVEHGGSGGGILELAVVVEEFGRGMVPGPFVPTTIAGALLCAAGRMDLAGQVATATSVAAVGLSGGTLDIIDGPAPRLRGTSDPIPSGAVADIFILAARRGDEMACVVIARDALSVEELASHDPTRRLSRVTVDAELPQDAVLTGLPYDVARDLEATIYAAEASGIAAWCVEAAAEYARTRKQFGRLVGQFQGVKHRIARGFADAEKARAVAWDAARAATEGAGGAADRAGRAVAAAVAAAIAPTVALQCAQDLIQTLGAIGFTWEHPANLYLRRAHTTTLLLDGDRWRRRVADLSVAGHRRPLNVDLPARAESIRSEVAQALQPAVAMQDEDRRRYLAENGFSVPHLTAPWGRGADAVTQLVIDEEMHRLGLDPVDLLVAAWVVPTLVVHGSQAQQERFLPDTLRGALRWCQLFSEPEAGSDLAGLSTRATPVEGGWVLHGQKVWTTMATEAQWAVCLARSDQTVAKHRGLSYFLVDMSAPGLRVRPIRELTGEFLFNEVWLDDVFVSDDCLVGQPGEGWRLARTTLANERVALSGDSIGSPETALLQAISNQADPDPVKLGVLGGAISEAQAIAVLSLRSTFRSMNGAEPGAESSLAKLLATQHQQHTWAAAMSAQGLDAATGLGEDSPAYQFLKARCLTIAGGTTDILLNIIGERLLGLPRDP